MPETYAGSWEVFIRTSSVHLTLNSPGNRPLDHLAIMISMNLIMLRHHLTIDHMLEDKNVIIEQTSLSRNTKDMRSASKDQTVEAPEQIYSKDKYVDL